jgi:hypothetical protein
VTLVALLLSVVLGAASLAWGYFQVGLASLGRWPLIFGVIWLIAIWRRWRWFSYVGLGFYVLAAALGLWFLSFPPGWMFAGAICGLLAWDLTYFRYRQRFAANEHERRVVEQRHLLGLAVMTLLGFILSSVAMVLQLQFNFEWAALLALVSALALAQIIGWFRKRN